MLEIKTITEKAPHHFDRAVNAALAEGWELVRRECFITGSDRATTFYAELERAVDDPEEEETDDDNAAEWHVTRDPEYPFKCTACGCKCAKPLANCPNCKREMVGPEVE